MGIITRNTGVYSGTLIGTAAGTTTISSEPVLLHSIIFPNRLAGSQIILYDSVGTSGTVIGTFVLGTQPGYDSLQPLVLDIRTSNALSVANSANLGCMITIGV